MNPDNNPTPSTHDYLNELEHFLADQKFTKQVHIDIQFVIDNIRKSLVKLVNTPEKPNHKKGKHGKQQPRSRQR